MQASLKLAEISPQLYRHSQYLRKNFRQRSDCQIVRRPDQAFGPVFHLWYRLFSVHLQGLYHIPKTIKMKTFKTPNTYVIIFFILILCAAATWFVPGGEYIESADGSGVEYTETESAPQTWQIASALYTGFTQQAGIIVFVLIIGGAFFIVNSTKAIDTGIMRFIGRASSLERYRFFRSIGIGNMIIVMVMLLFGVFGAVFGMSEETIAFTAIIIPLAVSLGYDPIVGVCMVYVAAHTGFAGAMLNPFTVGIAQEMSGLQLFSGIGYRTLCWAILMAIAIVTVLLYARRVKKNPEISPVYGPVWDQWKHSPGNVPAATSGRAAGSADAAAGASVPAGAAGRTAASAEGSRAGASAAAWWTFLATAAAVILFAALCSDSCMIKAGNSMYHAPYLLWAAAILFIASSVLSLRDSSVMFIMNLLIFTIIFLIIGVMGYGWYITEISALFFVLALASGCAAGYSPDRIAKEFIEGAKDIFSAALVIGFAAGIIIILKDGRILDTILHSLAGSLDGSARELALASMYGIQNLINIFIPSASAKAAITMPVMAPFSDMIGISRQTAVLAFQFGDGFTNMITPCSGVLLAVLSIARIPYAVWVRWIWKFILVLLVAGFILLLPTLYCSIAGF